MSRIDDLYIVNTTAGWAKDQIAILIEMIEGGQPAWIVEELRRIRTGISTVHEMEDERAKRKAGRGAPTPHPPGPDIQSSTPDSSTLR